MKKSSRLHEFERNNAKKGVFNLNFYILFTTMHKNPQNYANCACFLFAAGQTMPENARVKTHGIIIF